MQNSTPFAALALALACVGGAPIPAIAADDADAPRLEFAFEEIVTLAPDIRVGPTSLGRRNIIPITGGRFEGPSIKGTIIPGGWDWQLIRQDGCLQIEADYMLKTDDGVVINVINKGVACRGADGKPVPLRTQPVFEAPLGKYEWLGKSAFVGTLEPVQEAGAPAVRIRFYKVI
ncbi:DUF3237 domain-containing protein [Novosphingobium sp. SL115]|uniref:DUF3237 domain-containing protein n=1 Tax=Novosphingobium sp. SL115 TaxID=2995150 RepID=UPI00227332CD|nr:DUF3237 domain-containing protein [Novosphingobium sp. SL115]MCY1672598.1 DUF3237 domain-containing protein [Novosphingobium sp. SL115]